MAMTNGAVVEPCSEHPCCIRAPRVEASRSSSHLAGEWHLQWMAEDSAWFLVPPRGNVKERRVTGGADPVSRLAVDDVLLDDVREAIARDGLFPPC